jgi:hypothetical protein
MDFFLVDLVVLSLSEDPLAISIFKPEAELAQVDASVIFDLATNTVGKTVDEPPFVEVWNLSVSATLEVQNSSESVEVLCGLKDLTLVLVVLLFGNLHQFTFKSIWVVDLWTLIWVSYIVEWRDSSVLLDPLRVEDEVALRNLPAHELHELGKVLSEVLDDRFVVHQVFFSLFDVNFSIIWVYVFVDERSWKLICWLDHYGWRFENVYLAVNGHVLHKRLLGLLGQAVVTGFLVAEFADVNGAKSLAVTLVADFNLLVVCLVQVHLDLREVVWDEGAVVSYARIIGADLPVNQGLVLQQSQQVKNQW